MRISLIDSQNLFVNKKKFKSYNTISRTIQKTSLNIILTIYNKHLIFVDLYIYIIYNIFAKEYIF